MKIISKYKDYYDYLQGIYGVDPKLILDRRTLTPINKLEFKSKGKVYVYLCGTVYEGWCDGEQFYYGEELLKFGEPRKTYFWDTVNKSRKEITIKTGNKWIDVQHVATVPYKDTNEFNNKQNYPVLVSYRQTSDSFDNIPLKFINFVKVKPAEEIFVEISSWLSHKITKQEQITETRTEIERIESRGFDKKRSFRNM